MQSSRSLLGEVSIRALDLERNRSEVCRLLRRLHLPRFKNHFAGCLPATDSHQPYSQEIIPYRSRLLAVLLRDDPVWRSVENSPRRVFVQSWAAAAWGRVCEFLEDWRFVRSSPANEMMMIMMKEGYNDGRSIWDDSFGALQLRESTVQSKFRPNR